MNSDLKAQLRELNITAAKVGQVFLAKNCLAACCLLIFADVIMLVEWCFLLYMAYDCFTMCCCSISSQIWY